MESRKFIFSSESVSEGHPDKVADQISDAVVDACLASDPRSRVACETLVKNNIVVLAGEITTGKTPDYDALVRDVIRDIGYDEPELGFDTASCTVHKYLSLQSTDIAMGVDVTTNAQHEQGAGDQGLMFGFACDETPELMPLPISLAHALTQELARQRKTENVSFIKPDSKSQVSVVYENGRPKSVSTVIISTQHSPDISLSDLKEYCVEKVIKRMIPAQYLTPQTKFLVNPTGRFVIGGPVGDCGVTGRKIIVDTYGGYARHGGGAFSGKDPSKVDRSACYACRHIAKNVVAAGLATRCEVQVAYAIGVAEPVSIYVDTAGTAKVPEGKIESAVREIFSLTPRGIIESLSLLKPIFRKTSNYGHFGHETLPTGEFSWEKTDKVEALKKALG